jgi:Mrp family chromosome partitioning ATPase
MPLNLLKVAEKGAPLSVAEHDANHAAIESAVNTLEASVAGGGVSSVHGRTGAVTAAEGDYAASQVTATPGGGLAGSTVAAQLAELLALLGGKVGTGDSRLSDARALLNGSTVVHFFIHTQVKSADYTLIPTDAGTEICFTAAATLTVPSAATLGNGSFRTVVWNASGGNVVIDGTGSTNVTLSPGEVATIACLNGQVRVAEGATVLIS